MPAASLKMLDMLAELVAIPSVSSSDHRFNQSNRKVVEALASWLEDLGFAVEMVKVAADPDKFNLIARLGEGEEGLVLAGHTDTVPYDENRWRSDPFKLTERDGRIYGLGTADMKGFFPLVIDAVRRLDQRNLKQPLTILATADEESTMAGAKALLADGRRPGRYAVIGEPTGLQPIRMHKGIITEFIRVTGQTGHASDPRYGNNAIDGMVKIMSHLLAWRQELATRFHDPAFAVATPTLNLGSIHGGDSPNRICGQCELKIDIRLLPSMSLAKTRQELREQVEQALIDSGLRLEMASFYAGEPFATDVLSEIVKITEQLTGQPAGTVAFATEGPFLNALGTETVILGPGDISCAHQPDEHLDLDRLNPTIKLFQQLIHHFCL